MSNPAPDSSLCRAGAPRLRPLQLLHAPRLRLQRLLLPNCVRFDCCFPARALVSFPAPTNPSADRFQTHLGILEETRSEIVCTLAIEVLLSTLVLRISQNWQRFGETVRLDWELDRAHAPFSSILGPQSPTISHSGVAQLPSGRLRQVDVRYIFLAKSSGSTSYIRILAQKFSAHGYVYYIIQSCIPSPQFSCYTGVGVTWYK